MQAFHFSFWFFPSPRRPGPGGDGGVEAWDGMTPLHLACAAGLDNVVQCLVEHKANVNSKVSSVCQCYRLLRSTKFTQHRKIVL